MPELSLATHIIRHPQRPVLSFFHCRNSRQQTQFCNVDDKNGELPATVNWHCYETEGT